MTKGNLVINDSAAMRDLGRSLKDKGFFEINLSSEKIEWANEFALNRLGYTLDHVRGKTVYDFVPEEFHEYLKVTISDHVRGRHHRFSIHPGISVDGNIVWWYSVKIRSEHPIYWYRTEYLSTTEPSGPEFNSMCAAMHTANGYNELCNQVADLKDWTNKQINRIDKDQSEVKSEIRDMRGHIDAAIKAAHRAANAALENSAAISSFKSEMSDQLARHTTEIIKLISTDKTHSEQLEKFDQFMSDMTRKAIQTMNETTRTAVNEITTRASKAGDGISKKVTIPVGVIAAIAAIIQYLIQYYAR